MKEMFLLWRVMILTFCKDEKGYLDLNMTIDDTLKWKYSSSKIYSKN